MVKEIERVGIPVVHMCTITPISLTVGANRIIPTVAIPHPLGNPALTKEDEYALRYKLTEAAIKGKIAAKDGSSLVGNMAAQGTTPRRLTDLIGSLCDLTSGSGDKGTPIIYIQGYFDNYTND